MIENNASLLRLMAWLSPVFPIGSFAYSAGLEQAREQNIVMNSDDLSRWLNDLLTIGSTWNDAVLFSNAWQQAKQKADLSELICLAEAMAGTHERYRETIQQGIAFLKAAEAWEVKTTNLRPECPLPIAVGARCADANIDLVSALSTYLQAFVSNQLQAAIRLSIIGQTNALEILAKFETALLEIAQRASQSTLDDLGSFTIQADILSMRHENLESRIFQS